MTCCRIRFVEERALQRSPRCRTSVDLKMLRVVYGAFSSLAQNGVMDASAAARAYNQKAIRENWYYFCDPTLSFSLPMYDRLLSTWRAKAGARMMPARSEMTARDLKDVLRNIVLVERDVQNPKRFSWRLAGQTVTEVL